MITKLSIVFNLTPLISSIKDIRNKIIIKLSRLVYLSDENTLC